MSPSQNNRPAGNVAFDNNGRVAIVTGGTGGIGIAICESFADTGAQVVCVDVREPADAFSSERIAFRRTDVSDEESCRDTIEWVVSQFGGLDVLINNAAIQPVESFVPLHELSRALWNQSLAVNISGYTFMAKHAVLQMMQQHSGVILNMASAQAHRTAREVPAYGPTKAANILQARQWAIEYARYGIRVCSISPGAIDTPLVRASLEKQGGQAELANRHPLGRIGRSEEIAGAALWLASDGASFVTATDLEVDGGLGGYASFADPYPMG